MESQPITENLDQQKYISAVKWKWRGTVAALVVSTALTVASVAGAIIAVYAMINTPGSSYALYHSVKVILLGSLGAGFGVVIISRLARYATKVYRELQETKDSENVEKILKAKQQQNEIVEGEIDEIKRKEEGKLEELKDNPSACEILEDIKRDKYGGGELALLGTVVLITVVVMIAFGYTSVASGGLISHDLSWVWLGCGVGGVIGAGLFVYGISEARSARKMAEAVADLSIEAHRQLIAAHLDRHFRNSTQL